MPTFRVIDMNCDGCVRAITAAVRAVAPTVTVQTDLASQELRITGAVGTAVLIAALRDAGFTPELRVP